MKFLLYVKAANVKMVVILERMAPTLPTREGFWECIGGQWGRTREQMLISVSILPRESNWVTVVMYHGRGDKVRCRKVRHLS